MYKNIPRVLIASLQSGSGKTLITAALAIALKHICKIPPRIYKCGPDYIDPMFHRKTGCTAGTMDLFFSSEQEVNDKLANEVQNGQIAVFEGVMGLFDGIGAVTAEASSFYIAGATQTPVVLVVDMRGMSLSVCALIQGAVRFVPKNFAGAPARIAGVILNRCPSGLAERLAPVIEENCAVSVFGAVPDTEELHIPHRYLGLTLPDEQKDIRVLLEQAAHLIETHVDISAILAAACSAPPVKLPELPRRCGTEASVRTDCCAPTLAVARDEAFCFYYEENIALLKQCGFSIAYFSPLRDTSLPDEADAVYIGGGYPELYAAQLEANTLMRNTLYTQAACGMPVFAECGGYLYLHRNVTCQDGRSYTWCGIVDGDCMWAGRLQRFGYITLCAKQDTLLLSKGETIRAHEFHYFTSTAAEGSCTAHKPAVQTQWDCIYIAPAHMNLFAGFPHLYLPSHPHAAQAFAAAAARYGKKRLLP